MFLPATMPTKQDSPRHPEASADTQYRTVEVARILAVTPVRVRKMVRAGLCRPGRRGRAFRFTFQDLVLLRTAHGLFRSGVAPRRIRRALGELVAPLPAERPLSGMRVYADGQRVVVREGRRAWQPDSGQQVFVFDVDDLARRSRVVVPAARRPAKNAKPAGRRAESAQDWFERGLDLEVDDPRAARAAYTRALELDSEMTDAYVNLGRLMHQLGDLENAAKLYRGAIDRSDDAIAHYNLALVLEDRQDFANALQHYQRAVELDRNFADAHFNLGRLLERAGRSEEALRHLLAYRRLTGPKGKGDGETR